MKKTGYFIPFIILLLLQICICDFFRLSQFVVLTVLPVTVLLIPISRGTVFSLFAAFLAGLAVDLLSDGLLGLNVLSLVPVAFARRGIIRLVFGEETFARHEDISINKSGFEKMSLAIFMAQTLFLAIYIWADGAGTRPLWFGFARYGASVISGCVLSLIAADILTSERKRDSRI